MAKLDLNLMAVLEAIYDEGNTSKAGEILFLSQSAVSHALARLRTIYQDPLFIRQGHTMAPTPLTERVISKVKIGLREIRSSLDEAHQFDPSTHKQDFSLGMRDAMESALLAPLLSRSAQLAPFIHLNSRYVPTNEIENQLNFGKLDLCIEQLKPVNSQIHHTLLFHENLVLVGRLNHPALTSSCTIEDFLKHQHILVTQLEHQPEWVDHTLASRGIRREVVLRCQSYASAMQVLINSDYLSIIPRGYVELCAKHLPIQYISTPFEVPTIDVHIYWHQRHDVNPANIWLRQQIVMALNDIPFIQTAPTAMEWVSQPRDN